MFDRKAYNKVYFAEKIKCPDCQKEMCRGSYYSSHKNNNCPKNGSLKKAIENLIISITKDKYYPINQKLRDIENAKERLKKCS